MYVKTITTSQPNTNEVRWQFNEIAFAEDDVGTTVEGAIKFAFLPGALGRSIYPTMKCNATLHKFLKSQTLSVNCRHQDVNSLSPWPSEQKITNAKNLSKLFFLNGVSLILVLIRMKFSSVGEEARVKDRIGPSGSSLVPRSKTAYCPAV
jgi:Fe-S cluster biosynthesis and repair protein YggX